MTRHSTIIRGHALREEGAPFTIDRKRIGSGWGHRGGTGYALCECGAMSPLLDSDRQRKQWHRAHKAEVA